MHVLALSYGLFDLYDCFSVFLVVPVSGCVYDLFEGFGRPANDGVGYLITLCWDYGGQVRSSQAYNKPRPKLSKQNFDS